MSSTMVEGPPGEGTRARRRRTNRRRIAETAVELFERNGYTSTTVDEIAESCDIGRRTFFRYFQGKEELLYPFLEESRARVAAVLAQLQGDVAPVAAMRAALLDAATDFQRDAEFHKRCSAIAVLQNHEGRPVADSSRPVLNDRALRQTEVDLAEMMQVDPTLDPRPGLIAGCAITVFSSAYVEWIGTSSSTPLPDLVSDRFTLICQLLVAV
jgi:TetR/AcrR family transcriptional regulator, regulator of mycofactocin system